MLRKSSRVSICSLLLRLMNQEGLLVSGDRLLLLWH
jgi:hypothetical protein